MISVKWSLLCLYINENLKILQYWLVNASVNKTKIMVQTYLTHIELLAKLKEDHGLLSAISFMLDRNLYGKLLL